MAHKPSLLSLLIFIETSYLVDILKDKKYKFRLERFSIYQTKVSVQKSPCIRIEFKVFSKLIRKENNVLDRSYYAIKSLQAAFFAWQGLLGVEMYSSKHQSSSEKMPRDNYRIREEGDSGSLLPIYIADSPPEDISGCRRPKGFQIF